MDELVYSKEDREESDHVHKFLYKGKMDAKSDEESKDYERVINYITKLEDKYAVGVELNVKLVGMIDELSKGGIK